MELLGKDVEPIFILDDEMVLSKDDEYNMQEYKENNLHCIFYEEVLPGDDCNGVEPEYDRNCILMMITILGSTRSTIVIAVRGTQEPSEGAARR